MCALPEARPLLSLLAQRAAPSRTDAARPGAVEGTSGQSAECPIKKTIDGKTYCFQNDPALTKPQGGDCRIVGADFLV